MKLEKNDFIEDIERWIYDFFDIMKIYNENENTTSHYEYALHHFKEYCLGYQDDYSMTTLNSRFFLGFVRYLKTEHNHKSSTINQYIIVVKLLFKHISKNNFSKHDYENIIDDLKPIKDDELKNKKVKHFKKNDREKLIEFVENKAKGTVYKAPSFLALRNYFIIKILLFSGIRASELSAITIDNINICEEDKQLYTIDIKGKGGKERTTTINKNHFNEGLYKAYLNYLNSMDRANNHFICTKKGAKLDRKRIWEVTTSICNKCNIKVGNPHSFRHSFGTRLIVEENINPAIVQDMLGHQDLKTTMKFYVHISKEDSQKVAKNLL